MGYMEGNLSGMDYSYGGAGSHYPLWKPPSGYFPRGEAPPPYEEAVAISQAEALSAQCTVSVATTTHRAVDMAAELRRGNQLQQQQPLPQQQLQQQQPMGQLAQQQSIQQHVASLPHHHQQQNQITQSTTNLINININSGGNVTTIATGENHQPPYSLQNENNSQMLHTAQEHQLQHQQLQQHQHPAVVSGRLHLPPSNSICVQTMSQHQQQQQLTLVANPNTGNGAKQLQHQQQQQFQQTHQQQQALCQAMQVTECSYKNCQLNTAQRCIQRTSLPAHAQDMLQQYVTVADVDMSTAAAGCSVAGGDFELIASPTQFSNNVTGNSIVTTVSTPTIDMLPPMTGGEICTITSTPNTTGHHTLPSPHSNTLNAKCGSSSSSSGGNKTPSSARRYHRTIPRYFAVSDPLSANVNVTNTSSVTKCASKSSATNTPTTVSSAAVAAIPVNAPSSASSVTTGAKKPTCQCPVQHVPMSYMGTNQLNMNAQQHMSNNAFLSALSHKITPSACSSSSSSNHSGRSSLSYGHRSRSSVSSAQQSASDAFVVKRSTHNVAYCNHEPKISTISKQVGDSAADIATVSHHHHQNHQHHHQNDGPLVVLSKVPKKSSQDRLKSGARSESNAAIYLNGKVDAYLNYPNHQHLQGHVTDSNPVLPPKLYKSLTNLKAPLQTSSSATYSSKNHCITSSASATSSPQISYSTKASLNNSTDLASSALNSTSSAQTVYSIKPADYQPASKLTTIRKDELKNVPPSLTLPPPSLAPNSSGGNINSVELKSSKINSSTFYPLQNNHVTYTLPKHISGKMSLNSTIANVVSKVPSVISIPATESCESNFHESNSENPVFSSKSLNGNKCTTLPKILRIKRDTKDPTMTQVTVSQCNMPIYPQQATTQRVNESGSNNSSNIRDGLHLPVCTTSKNCLNPKEHFLPNDTSLDDDYLSECENCKIAQSSKYYLNAEILDPPQETMTLQRKSMDDNKEDQEQAYYRISHTLPTNPKKNAPSKNNNREPWFSTIPASSSSEEDLNE